MQAQYSEPSLEQDSPDGQLLRKKVQEVFERYAVLHRLDPEAMPAIDVEEMPATGQTEWLRRQGFGLRWENGDQPVVDGLDLWRKP